ncbi:MAG: tetratricopeptide repeat protein, partial [Desulfomonilaceae bacterium]
SGFVLPLTRGKLRLNTILGAMYYNALGVSQDINEAVKWFRLAADQGDVDAQIVVSKIQSDLKMTKRHFTVQSRET